MSSVCVCVCMCVCVCVCVRVCTSYVCVHLFRIAVCPSRLVHRSVSRVCLGVYVVCVCADGSGGRCGAQEHRIDTHTIHIRETRGIGLYRRFQRSAMCWRRLAGADVSRMRCGGGKGCEVAVCCKWYAGKGGGEKYTQKTEKGKGNEGDRCPTTNMPQHATKVHLSFFGLTLRSPHLAARTHTHTLYTHTHARTRTHPQVPQNECIHTRTRDAHTHASGRPTHRCLSADTPVFIG